MFHGRLEKNRLSHSGINVYYSQAIYEADNMMWRTMGIRQVYTS